jgi:hypothetical protein
MSEASSEKQVPVTPAAAAAPAASAAAGAANPSAPAAAAVPAAAPKSVWGKAKPKDDGECLAA